MFSAALAEGVDPMVRILLAAVPSIAIGIGASKSRYTPIN
jgi:hypothetical protein